MVSIFAWKNKSTKNHSSEACTPDVQKHVKLKVIQIDFLLQKNDFSLLDEWNKKMHLTTIIACMRTFMSNKSLARINRSFPILPLSLFRRNFAYISLVYA